MGALIRALVFLMALAIPAFAAPVPAILTAGSNADLGSYSTADAPNGLQRCGYLVPGDSPCIPLQSSGAPCVATAFVGTVKTAIVPTNQLNVSAVTSGTLRPGLVMPAGGIFSPGITIARQISGTPGGVGVYELSQPFNPPPSFLLTVRGDGASQIPSSNNQCWQIRPTAVTTDIRSWGVRTDGSDSSFALQAAFTWAAANARTLLLPPGNVTFGTGIAVTLPAGRQQFSVLGAGRDQSFLAYTGTGAAITINYVSLVASAAFADFTMTTNGAGTANGLALTSSVPTLTSANMGITTLTRLGFYGSDGGFGTNFFGVAVPIIGVDQVNFTDTWIAGGSFQGIGVTLAATTNACCAVQYNFATPVMQSLATGIEVKTNFVQGIYINEGSLTNANNILVDSGTGNGVVGISLVNSTANGHNTVNLQSCTAGVYIGFNDIFTDSTGTGVLMPHDCGAVVIGNTFSADTGSAGGGIETDATTGTSGDFFSFNQFINLATGIKLDANATNVQTAHNGFNGVTTPITNASTLGGNLIGSPATLTFGSAGATLAAASTFFCSIGCGASETVAEFPLAGHTVNGIFVDYLEVIQSAAPGGAVSNSYTWRCNGVNSALTTSIAAAATFNHDTTHGVLYTTSSGGSLLCDVLAVIGAGAVAATVQGAVRVGINP